MSPPSLQGPQIRVAATAPRPAKSLGSSASAAIVTDGKRRVTIVIPPAKTANSSQPESANDHVRQPAVASSPITLDSDIEEADLGSASEAAAGQAVTDGLSVGTATSTAVERVFSQGRQLLHFTRNRLSDHSIRAFLCLGAWIRHDLVSLNDFATVLRRGTQKRK